MKRIALVSFATLVAFSHFASAQIEPSGQQVLRRPAPTGGVARPLQVQQPQHASGARQMPAGLQQLHRNAPGTGAGIIRSPRLYHGDVNPAPRVQPSNPTTPEQARVLRPGAAPDRTDARDWRNRVGAGNDWRNRNGGGNDQTQNNNELRRRHGDGNHHWHHDWDHNHHPRDWWRNHYTQFVLFGGGYYYLDAGFWYPAYGYDPYFSTYVYDAPIYGSDSLSPAAVMSSVQTELARLGYYNGPIDGTYGPLTREALLQYQQSAGLEVTGLLDQPTLESLGLY